jgi:hypothetical protein
MGQEGVTWAKKGVTWDSTGGRYLCWEGTKWNSTGGIMC